LEVESLRAFSPGLLALDLAGPPFECSGHRTRVRWLKTFQQEQRRRALDRPNDVQSDEAVVPRGPGRV